MTNLASCVLLVDFLFIEIGENQSEQVDLQACRPANSCTGNRQVPHKLVIKDLPAGQCGGKQRVRYYLAAHEASWRPSGWWM